MSVYAVVLTHHGPTVSPASLGLGVCVRTRAIGRDLIEICRDLIEIGRDIISTSHITECW